MAGVSDVGNQNNIQFLLQNLRTRLNDTQRTISTGKKSETLANLGTLGASNALAYRNKIALLTGYTSNLNIAKSKLTVMDGAMSDITKSARETLAMLRSQLQGSSPKATIVANDANAQLQSVLQRLNVQVNGQYQFSGDDLATAPFASATNLDTNVGGLVSGFMAGSPTVASVKAAARGVTGTALGYSNGVGTSGNVSFRADDNTDIDYTVKADQSGFADIIRGMNLIKNLPQPTTQTEQNNYWTVVNAAIELIDEGARSVDSYQGVLGAKAQSIDELLTQHDELTGTYNTFIGTIEDADVAEAATNLQNLQVQLQASYSIIAKMQSLSLVNFL